MDIETLREYCLRHKGVKEEFPFGNNTLVFKVSGKIFLLVSLDQAPLQFNAKCDPEQAEALRERYPAVLPGYHMNKKHWNTIVVDGSLGEKMLREIIDDSYRLVLQSLPLSARKKLL